MDSTWPCAQDDGTSDIRPSARDDSCPSRALLLRRSSMSCAYCRSSVVVAGFCVVGVGRSTSHHHRLVAGCEAVVPHVPSPQTPRAVSFTCGPRFFAIFSIAGRVTCTPSDWMYPSLTLPSQRVNDGVLSANLTAFSEQSETSPAFTASIV